MSTPSSPLSPAEQARIRRERRQAKVREGGSSRLAQITSTQSGSVHAQDPAPTPAPSASSPPSSSHGHGDPPIEDITISSRPDLHTAPNLRPTSTDPLFEAAAQSGDDPMLALLSQLQGAGGAGGMPGFPGMGGIGGLGGMPGMGGMMPPGMAGMPGMDQPQVDPESAGKKLLWRVIHAVSAVVLGVWFGFFSGNRISLYEDGFTRTQATTSNSVFWYFVLMEVMLMTGRYVLEGGKKPGVEGALGMLGGMLPPAVQGLIGEAMRYWQVFGTVGRDAGVLVFVLGVAAWCGAQ